MSLLATGEQEARSLGMISDRYEGQSVVAIKFLTAECRDVKQKKSPGPGKLQSRTRAGRSKYESAMNWGRLAGNRAVLCRICRVVPDACKRHPFNPRRGSGCSGRPPVR